MRFFNLLILLLLSNGLFGQKSEAEITRGDSIPIVDVIVYPNPIRVNERTFINIQGGLSVGYEVISYDIYGGPRIHDFRTTARQIGLSFRDPGIKSVTVWITMPSGKVKKYERKLFVNE